MLYIILHIITLILSVSIFVCHIVLQSDHIGTLKVVIFNQRCCLMLLVLIIFDVRQMFFVETVSVLDATFIPAWVLTYLVIICIETRFRHIKGSVLPLLKRHLE